MTIHEPTRAGSTLQQLVELRWQRELIARWLEGTAEALPLRSQLEEILARVNAALGELEGPSDWHDETAGAGAPELRKIP